jgi:hypothetical protein
VEIDVVIDEMGAEVAEEFAGAVGAAVGGAIEFQDALTGEVVAVVLGGDQDREFQQVADPAEVDGTAQEILGMPSVQEGMRSAAVAANSAVGCRSVSKKSGVRRCRRAAAKTSSGET